VISLELPLAPAPRGDRPSLLDQLDAEPDAPSTRQRTVSAERQALLASLKSRGLPSGCVELVAVDVGRCGAVTGCQKQDRHGEQAVVAWCNGPLMFRASYSRSLPSGAPGGHWSLDGGPVWSPATPENTAPIRLPDGTTAGFIGRQTKATVTRRWWVMFENGRSVMYECEPGKTWRRVE
jgi:hypothetical protein